jgi:uncharacterized membrane protein YheB (UPF0754 family)
MQPMLFIAISVIIAAGIGGITNHLAIKMLFHPRKKLFIAGKRIPFTPGLIPKRRDEIARSLGNVVGDYLVTSEGLGAFFQKPEFRQKLEAKIMIWVEEWTLKEETLVQVAGRFWTPDQVQGFKDKLAVGLKEISENGIGWLWDKQHEALLTLGEMVPDWTEEKKEQFVEWVVDYLIAEIKLELSSPSGDKMLRQLTGQVMEQAGGLLGALAGIFMDEDKMAQKVRSIIDGQIHSPRVRSLAVNFLHKKISEWERMRLTDAVESWARRDGKSWVLEKSGELLKWPMWIDQLSSLQLKQIFGTRKAWIQGKIPAVTDSILQVIASNIDRVVAAVELPKLVEQQVEQFPMERLEQIILSVSGHEFRAITWLGALLGGMIGLFQAIMLLWYM